MNSTPQLTPEQLEQHPPSSAGLDSGQGDEQKVSVNKTGKASVATVLVGLAKSTGIDLFHTPDLKAFATFKVNNHYEAWALKSRAFKNWMSKLYFEVTGKAANSQASHDAMNVLAVEAQFSGSVCDVFVRVAGHNGSIFLDLCGDKWRVVEIAQTGWRIIDNPPVRFRRPGGMQALPDPVKGGKWEEVRVFLNIQNDDGFILFSSWTIGSLHPSGPYPVLDVHGEHGTAKTTLCRIARTFIDPYKHVCERCLETNVI